MIKNNYQVLITKVSNILDDAEVTVKTKVRLRVKKEEDKNEKK